MVARSHPGRPGESEVGHLAGPAVILACGDLVPSWACSLCWLLFSKQGASSEGMASEWRVGGGIGVAPR